MSPNGARVERFWHRARAHQPHHQDLDQYGIQYLAELEPLVVADKVELVALEAGLVNLALGPRRPRMPAVASGHRRYESGRTSEGEDQRECGAKKGVGWLDSQPPPWLALTCHAVRRRRLASCCTKRSL